MNPFLQLLYKSITIFQSNIYFSHIYISVFLISILNNNEKCKYTRFERSWGHELSH